MDFVFRDLPCVHFYLEDVVVHSTDAASHLNDLLSVFQVISCHGLKVKISKCRFAQSRVCLLGHIIDRDGIRGSGEGPEYTRCSTSDT